jgi:hypothetical protein
MSVRMMEQLVGEQSSNAYEWSKAFCGAYEELFDISLDESYVHTVFANAIMAALDGYYNEEIQKLKTDREVIVEALKIFAAGEEGIYGERYAAEVLKSIGEIE